MSSLHILLHAPGSSRCVLFIAGVLKVSGFTQIVSDPRIKLWTTQMFGSQKFRRSFHWPKKTVAKLEGDV